MTNVTAATGEVGPAALHSARAGKGKSAEGGFASLFDMIGQRGARADKTGTSEAGSDTVSAGAAGDGKTVTSDGAVATVPGEARPVDAALVDPRLAWLVEGSQAVSPPAMPAPESGPVVSTNPEVQSVADAPTAAAQVVGTDPAPVVVGAGAAAPRTMELRAAGDATAGLAAQSSGGVTSAAAEAPQPPTGDASRDKTEARPLKAQARHSPAEAPQVSASEVPAEARSELTVKAESVGDARATPAAVPATVQPATAEVRLAAASSAVTPSPATASGADDTGTGDAQRDPTGGRAPGAGLTTARREATQSDGATAEAGPALHEIVSSLPPVVQAQLEAATSAPASGVATPLAVQATASTGALLSSQVIDMSVQGQWIDRMAQEIATLADGTGHSRFQLSPPNLGRIQVDLWQTDSATHVRLLAETDDAARRLREGQGALEANARMVALPLASVSVEKSGAPLDSNREQADAQTPRQGETMNGQGRQQAEGGQNSTRGGINQNGVATVMGDGQPAEPAIPATPERLSDPRVRFA
jgi:flagellar hook-length control protein FliK